MYIEKDSNKKYLEQWKRLNRYYEKVQVIERGGVKQDDEECLDTIISFFLHCNHLKDWIFQSNKKLESELKDLFNKKKRQQCLYICGNVADASKHLNLTDPERDKNSKILHQNVRIDLGLGMSFYSWDISLDGIKQPVFPLVHDCMKEWNTFLNKHSLVLE